LLIEELEGHAVVVFGGRSGGTAVDAARIGEAAVGRLRRRFGGGVDPWVARLPALISECAVRWQLHGLGAGMAGSTSVVVRCESPFGPVVLKLTPEPLLASEEARALELWTASRHVVNLVDVGEDLGALLLEDVRPGIPLTQDSGWALREVVPLLSELFLGPTPNEPAALNTLTERVEFVLALSERRWTATPAAQALLPVAVLRRGREQALALAGSPGHAGLIHGDLHLSNVLRCGDNRQIVAIDPRPCFGDRHFDLVDWVLTPEIASREDFETRLDELGSAIPGLDHDNLARWSKAMAVAIVLPLLERTPDVRRVQFLVELATS
jgi:streptomycin 6-kinase